MLTALLTLTALARSRMRAAADDRGAFSAEYLIWTAALAVGAITVVAIIVSLLTNKASTISLE